MAGPKLFRDVVEAFRFGGVAASVVKYAADGRVRYVLALSRGIETDCELEVEFEELDDLTAVIHTGRSIIEFLDGRIGPLELGSRLH